MILKHMSMFKRLHFCFSSLPSKQQGLFRCSEIMLKSILSYGQSQPTKLSDLIIKTIMKEDSISKQAKQDIQKMFNPQKGIKLGHNLLTKGLRFRGALNKQQLYPMDTNPKLLKMIANNMFKFDQNKLIALRAPRPMFYYIGTPGLAKSCSFFNFSYILNLRVPFLASNPNYQQFLMKDKCKFLYFISTYNKQQIVETILDQLTRDFGSQLSNNLRKFESDWKKNQLIFGNYIARLVQPYKILKISVYVIIDQFNQLYLYENKVNDYVLWWNWREIAQMAAGPVMLVASKNNNIIRGQLDPVRIIARADQNITKVFPDKSPIKDKIKDFANSLCFEMEKNKFEGEQIIQVLKSIKSNMPLCSHLSAQKLVEQAIVGGTFDKKVTNMITILKNYPNYEDCKIMNRNLRSMVKQSLQKQNSRKSSKNIPIQNQNNNKLINDNTNEEQQKIQITKDNFPQYLNKGYIESQDQQIFRLRTFVDFYLNTQVQEIQTNFQYKSQKIELKSSVLYTVFESSILDRLEETPINYFLKDFKYNTQKRQNIEIVYSMLNEQQHQSLIQSIFDHKLTQYLNSNAKKKLNDTKDGQKFEADLKSQLNRHKLNKGFAIIIFILNKFNQFSKIKKNTVNFNIEQFYKFPMINKANNWLQHYYKKQISLDHYKKINEQNLLYKYTWDDLLGDIISVPCYFSASGSNKAFDILLTKIQDNKLHLHFVDFLCSNNSEAAKKKFNKFIVLFKQINIYVLLMDLANKQEVQKIQINYFVVNKLKQRSFSNFIQIDIKSSFDQTLKYENEDMKLKDGSKGMKRQQFNKLKTQLQKKLNFVVSQKQLLSNNQFYVLN